MLYLGAVALALRNPEIARSVLQESHIIAKNKMDRWAQAFSLDLLGQVAMSEGQDEEAGQLFQEALTLFQEIGDQWGATQSLIHLGDSKAALQQIEDAKRLLREAYRNASQAGWVPTISEVLIAFVHLDHEISPDTKLAVTLAVLQYPATAPHVRARAEELRAQLASSLTSKQIKTAQLASEEKSPEAWAQEILR
jgi:tetratricopeptide (TPR) repeat protein